MLIAVEALFLIVLPVAGGHDGVVISKQAADMYIASVATLTIYVARGIAGKEVLPPFNPTTPPPERSCGELISKVTLPVA